MSMDIQSTGTIAALVAAMVGLIEIVKHLVFKRGSGEDSPESLARSMRLLIGRIDKLNEEFMRKAHLDELSMMELRAWREQSMKILEDINVTSKIYANVVQSQDKLIETIAKTLKGLD